MSGWDHRVGPRELIGTATLNERAVMKSLFRHLRRFATEENGLAAVEYAVMLALKTGAVLLSITNLGLNVSGVYDNVSQSLSDLGVDAGGGAKGGEGGHH